MSTSSWRRGSLVAGLLLAGLGASRGASVLALGAAALDATGQLAADAGYAVVFYSGRAGNDDIYILHPGQHEPVNLTRHPARDHCPAASPDGIRIAFLSDRGGNFDIYTMAIDGSDVRQLTNSPEKEEHPEFSPDGGTIVFVRELRQRAELWVVNADGSGQRRLTSGNWRDERPFVSPDGSRILFMSNRDGNYEIYTMAADGSGQTRLTATPDLEIFPAWSPDGRQIVYSRKFRAEGRMEGMIRVMNADGTGDHEITGVATRDENGLWSPDGRSIIFQSVRDGNFEVYQVNADGSRPVRLTDHPAWDGWASFVPVSKSPGPTPAATVETQAGPTPAAIVDRHVAAIGGRDALRAVKTLVVRGRNIGLGGADRPLVRYLKHPSLLRQQDAPGATAFLVADGSKVYQVGPSGRAEVTQPWAAPLRHTTIDDGFLDLERRGARYEYLGREGIKTGPWTFHHLRRVFPDAYTEDLYFEADSGLLRMRVEDNGRAKRVFYDYRDVGGIRYPFLTATVFDGLEPPHLFIVDEVTLNAALEDGFFLKTGGLDLSPAGERLAPLARSFRDTRCGPE
jgi:TolB protein